MELTAEEIVLKYKDGRNDLTILNELNVTFKPGAVNVLIGPSGSGKSSLLYLLSGLRKATSGVIKFNDILISDTTGTEKIRYENFGFIFQHSFLIPYLNVTENICMARKDMDLKSKAEELLKKLKIQDLAKKKIYQLSGGEKQRVAIARALVKEPSVIFADEPTASLDKENAKNVFNILRKNSKDKIVIIATHDTSLINENDHVFVIDDGKIMEQNPDNDTKEPLQSRKKHKK